MRLRKMIATDKENEDDRRRICWEKCQTSGDLILSNDTHEAVTIQGPIFGAYEKFAVEENSLEASGKNFVSNSEENLNGEERENATDIQAAEKTFFGNPMWGKNGEKLLVGKEEYSRPGTLYMCNMKLEVEEKDHCNTDCAFAGTGGDLSGCSMIHGLLEDGLALARPKTVDCGESLSPTASGCSCRCSSEELIEKRHVSTMITPKPHSPSNISLEAADAGIVAENPQLTQNNKLDEAYLAINRSLSKSSVSSSVGLCVDLIDQRHNLPNHANAESCSKELRLGNGDLKPKDMCQYCVSANRDDFRRLSSSNNPQDVQYPCTSAKKLSHNYALVSQDVSIRDNCLCECQPCKIEGISCFDTMPLRSHQYFLDKIPNFSKSLHKSELDSEEDGSTYFPRIIQNESLYNFLDNRRCVSLRGKYIDTYNPMLNNRHGNVRTKQDWTNKSKETEQRSNLGNRSSCNISDEPLDNCHLLRALAQKCFETDELEESIRLERAHSEATMAEAQKRIDKYQEQLSEYEKMNIELLKINERMRKKVKFLKDRTLFLTNDIRSREEIYNVNIENMQKKIKYEIIEKDKLYDKIENYEQQMIQAKYDLVEIDRLKSVNKQLEEELLKYRKDLSKMQWLYNDCNERRMTEKVKLGSMYKNDTFF